MALTQLKQANKKSKHEQRRKKIAYSKKQRALRDDIKFKQAKKRWEKEHGSTRRPGIEI